MPCGFILPEKPLTPPPSGSSPRLLFRDKVKFKISPRAVALFRNIVFRASPL